MIKAFRFYTGPDGRSHVEEGTIDLNVLVEATSIHFQETPAKSVNVWHTAPTSQYVITLGGTLEFVTVSGETFTVSPGSVLIAEDLTGSGHKWIMREDQPWKRAYVVFKEGTDTQFRKKAD